MPMNHFKRRYYFYETFSNFYLILYHKSLYHLLKLNRTIDQPQSLSEILYEDPIQYNKDEIVDILSMISEGNKNTGGLVKLAVAYGVLGFIKFLNYYYITLITGKKEVGCIGNHVIHTIKSTETFAIRPKAEFATELSLRRVWHNINKKINQTAVEIAESRYLGLFHFIDLSKDFFFSYSYDLTHSLQYNYNFKLWNAEANNRGKSSPFQEMFEWSKYQTDELRSCLGDEKAQYWIIPIIHGSFQQRRLSLFGQYIDLILLARRSRHYAGTRYLKRGTSVHGKVANDCETEMILQTHHGQCIQFASYLQMRGSVPTYWQQETSVTMPVPPIVVYKVDPSYRATQDHFSDLLRRYSYPILVLDLLKLSERTPRETILGTEFKNSISLLNSTLVGADRDKKLIRYCALDFSQISKCGIKQQQQQQQQHSQNSISEADQEFTQPMISTNKINTITGIKEKKLLSTDNTRITNQMSTTNNFTSVDLAGATSMSTTRIPFYATNSSSKKPLTSTSKAMSSGSQRASVVKYDREEGTRIDLPSTTSVLSSTQSGTIDKHHRSKSNTSPAMASLAFSDSTTEKGNVLADLEEIADWALAETLFFCSSTKYLNSIGIASHEVITKCTDRGHMEQRGVMRTNCLDCLDRTNVAQFSVGLKFLQHGLKALGLSGNHVTAPSNTMILNLMDMFSELGDRLALQYGGSEAHKKVSVGQGGSTGKSKHGDLLTSIKRYYSNAFTDRVKQDAMNLFLGYYVPILNEIPLWELETDYNLHNNYLFRKALYVETLLFNLGANSNRNKRFYSYKGSVSIFNKDDNQRNNNGNNDNNVNKTETKKRQVILLDTIEDDDENENENQSEDLSNFGSLYEIAKSKYLIPDTQIDTMIAKVKLAERRKRKVRRDTDEVLYALGNWWTEATIDYQMNRISSTTRTTTTITTPSLVTSSSTDTPLITLPITTTELLSPYEGELSNGITLLSFDQLLSYEFLQPVEASELPSSTSSSHSSYGKISLLKGYWTAGKSDVDSQQEDDQDGGSKAMDTIIANSTVVTNTMTTALVASRDSKLCSDAIRNNSSISKNNNSTIDNLIVVTDSRSTDIFDDKNNIIEENDLIKKFSQNSSSMLTLSSTKDSDSTVDVDDSRSLTKPSYNMIQPIYKSETATVTSVSSGGISLPVTGPKHHDSTTLSDVSSQDHSMDHPHPNHIVFNLGNYVRKISLKAKSFVDFIRRDHDHSHHNLPIQYNSYQTKKWGSGSWSLHDIVHEDSNIPMSSADAYIQYVQHAESPESMYDIDKNYSSRQHEMEYQLADTLIDCNDVTAMQQLAEDSHINTVIQEGLYKGIEQSQSAIWAAGLVNYAMILTEPLLENNIQSFCNEHTSSSSSSPSSTPLTSETNNILSKDIRNFIDELKLGHNMRNSLTTKSKDISIPVTTENLLERCMQGGGKDDFRTVAGLVQDGLYLAQEYQQQYLQYAEDISVDVLQRRINTTSNNESTLLHYCSLFSLESVGDDFKNVQYLISDLDKDDLSHMHDFESYVNSLQPYIKINEPENQKKIILPEEVGGNKFNVTANYKFDNKKRLNSGNDKLMGAKVEYTGFMEIQEDLYAKLDNSSFLLNEAAVNTFTNSHYLL